MTAIKQDVDLEKILEAHADRAHREFADAWSKITHPNVDRKSVV